MVVNFCPAQEYRQHENPTVDISNKFIKVFTLTVFSDISQDKKVALLRPEGDGGGRQFSGFQATYDISVHNF